MPRLTQDAFLNELTNMLMKSKQAGTGSVQLSFKRWALEEKKDKEAEKKEKKAKSKQPASGVAANVF